jgi:sigma-B regulation protein RsbU (phosphoserine phosphatase)
LLAVSAVNLLSARSLPGVDFRDPGAVLARLNDVFPMEKQHGKYFTMWYGIYHKPDRTLRFANAAHPPPLLFTGPTRDDASMQLLTATGLAIGIMEGAEYDTDQVALGPYGRLLLYSDGVYEIARPDGSMWSASDFAQFAKTLSPADGPVLDRVLGHVRQMHGSEVLADDFSILELSY